MVFTKMKYASILCYSLWRNGRFYPLEITGFPILWNKRNNRSVCLFYYKGWVLLAQQQCSYNKDYSQDLDVDDRKILKYIASRLHGWKVRGSNPGRGLRFFLFRKRPNWLFGQPSVWINGYQHYFLGLQWPEREVNPLTSTYCWG